MTYKEIQELIRQVSKSDLAEVKVKDGDSEVTIRTRHYSENKGGQVIYSQAPAIAQPSVSTTPAATPQAPRADAEKPAEPKSSNLKDVKPGDTISAGSVVCIIEAMKLFNEIESEVAGTIVKIMVEDASPVEYDQVLFLVE